MASCDTHQTTTSYILRINNTFAFFLKGLSNVLESCLMHGATMEQFIIMLMRLYSLPVALQLCRVSTYKYATNSMTVVIVKMFTRPAFTYIIFSHKSQGKRVAINPFNKNHKSAQVSQRNLRASPSKCNKA